MTNDVNGTAYDITWSFSAYNPASQIVTWGASSNVYDYKETVNTTVNKTFDGLNRDATIAAISGGFDARGNLTNDGTRTFTYDIENRLLTGTGTGNNLVLDYDPEGRLAKYSTDGGVSYTEFLYDGVNLIGEYSGGVMLRRYVHGSGMDEPLVWFEGAGTGSRYYFYQNYQGSVIGYTDASGNLAALYKYGPYGEPRNAANAEVWGGSRFMYTGQTVLDAKLYYYKARVYDPVFGRFLQTDPVGSMDDLDLYAYVGGDPINFIDPFGLETETVTVNCNDKCKAEFCARNPDSTASFCKGPCSGETVEYCWERGRGLKNAEDELKNAPEWRKDDIQALKYDCEIAEQNRDAALALVSAIEVYEKVGNAKLTGEVVMDAAKGVVRVGKIAKDLALSVPVQVAKDKIRDNAIKNHEKAKMLGKKLRAKGGNSSCTASGGLF